MGPYRFGARGVSRTVFYDAVLFGSGCGAGASSGTGLNTTNDNVLVTMHGEVVNANATKLGPELDHVLTVDQSFGLRRKRGGEDEEALVDHGGCVLASFFLIHLLQGAGACF
jgi:hypothetical protein